jgi:hypothetical protein
MKDFPTYPRALHKRENTASHLKKEGNVVIVLAPLAVKGGRNDDYQENIGADDPIDGATSMKSWTMCTY